MGVPSMRQCRLGLLLSAAALLVTSAVPLPASNMLPIGCSNPPLGIEYTDIKYYSGEVHCGSLLLESDIGGTHPWIRPKVTHAAAPDGLYTLMYIDPFVDIPGNGSWPSCGAACAGTKAPARHWVVGNIDSEMLRTGNLTAGSTVSAFKGPSPPWGSHPYGQFLFRQSSNTKIKFEELPSPSGIYNWDYESFIAL